MRGPQRNKDVIAVVRSTAGLAQVDIFKMLCQNPVISEKKLERCVMLHLSVIN